MWLEVWFERLTSVVVSGGIPGPCDLSWTSMAERGCAGKKKRSLCMLFFISFSIGVHTYR